MVRVLSMSGSTTLETVFFVTSLLNINLDYVPEVDLSNDVKSKFYKTFHIALLNNPACNFSTTFRMLKQPFY